MSDIMAQVNCKQCDFIFNGDAGACEANQVRDPSASYGGVEYVCPNCGAKNLLDQDVASEPALNYGKPRDEKAMREAIISILANLYPTRTGYNGGHLAPIRDPNPDLFFAVLQQLEVEGVIEYNDTQIAMRLNDEFMQGCGVSA